MSFIFLFIFFWRV